MEFIKIAVERRASAGTRNSRKIRGEGRVPAVLYGLGRDNASLSIEIEVFESFLATGSKLVELKLGDKVQQAILKDVQHDPLSDEVLHIDLQRIDEHHEIEAKVPLLRRNNCPDNHGVPSSFSSTRFDTRFAKTVK